MNTKILNICKFSLFLRIYDLVAVYFDIFAAHQKLHNFAVIALECPRNKNPCVFGKILFYSRQFLQ